MADKCAGKGDWKSQELPEKKAIIRVERRFSATEVAGLRHGLIPEEMEDKWFIYCDDDVLHFHRSWTGFEIFRVHLAPSGDEWEISSVEVNREFAQYEATDDEYDARLILYLIDVLLLGKNVDFPSRHDKSQPSASIQEWIHAGRAMFSKGQRTE
jgi:hypothetical protein